MYVRFEALFAREEEKAEGEWEKKIENIAIKPKQLIFNCPNNYSKHIFDPMTVAMEALQTNNMKLNGGVYEYEYETKSAECNCCGLKEEYTKSYIETVRQTYNGTWICGLCSEAIKDEIVRSERILSTEEAMQMHMTYCGSFKSPGPPPNPAVHLIAAMRQILRRSLESPRASRSLPSSPTVQGNGCHSSVSCGPRAAFYP